MVQKDRTAVVLHTIHEIAEDGVVADAWAFADTLCKQSGRPHRDVVTSYNDYTVQILVEPPRGATTISVWSNSLQDYVAIYRDDGIVTAQKFPDDWPDDLPLIYPTD